MRFGVIIFPGSNCDEDCRYVLAERLGYKTRFIWHKERNLSGIDCVVLPGGFSYGDYLRCGAIARFSPVMKSIVAHAKKGKLVLGICNGFQILVEAGLLPGALLRNLSLRFICRYVTLRVEETDTPFTQRLKPRELLRLPIAHNEGNYFVDQQTLEELEANRQILFRYCDAEGRLTEQANPNGAVSHIAGVCNRTRTILGMMPHPERASDRWLGSEDGLAIFQSMESSNGR